MVTTTGPADMEPTPRPVTAPDGPLTAAERMCLTIAGRHYLSPGGREIDVHRALGLNLLRFWQVVNGLLDRRAALEHAPQLVYQLRARRDLHAARSGRTRIGNGWTSIRPLTPPG